MAQIEEKRQEHTKKEGKLFSNTLILAFAAVLSKLAVFFLMPLYTAALTPSEFGTADILVSTAVLLLPMVSLNMPDAVFRFAAGETGLVKVFSTGGALMLAGSFLFALFCPFFAFSAVLRPYVLYLFLYVAASVFRSFHAHTLRARGQYLYYALQQLFCTLLTILLELLFLCVLHLGIRGYLAAVILADAVTGLVVFFCLRAWQWIRPRAVRGEVAVSMLRYALPLIPASALWWVTAVSDRYIILHYHGEALTGVYAAAGRLPSLLTFLLSIFMEAWHFAALREREENRSALFSRIYAMLLPALLTLALLLMLSSRFVVKFLFAESFSDAAYYVPLLLAAAFFSSLSTFVGSVYTVRLHTVSSLITALVAAVVNVVLNFLWIPRAGATGAALATLFAYATVFAIRVWDTGRVLSFSCRLFKLLPATAGLLLTAHLSVIGSPWAFLSALSTLLPFAAEIAETVRFTVRRTKIFLGIKQKK